jgi:hypothetical protein
MDYYTYIYYDPTDFTPIYVGKGKGLRCYDHLGNTQNRPLPNKIRKLRKAGLEPIIEFIVKDVDEQYALCCERFWIKVIGRRDLKTGTLLNLTDGGDGVTNISPQARQAISKRQKGKKLTEEHKAAVGASLKGVAKSKEHNAAVSASLKGHITSDETKAKQRESKLKAGIKPPSRKGVKLSPEAMARRMARLAAINTNK